MSEKLGEFLRTLLPFRSAFAATIVANLHQTGICVFCLFTRQLRVRLSRFDPHPTERNLTFVLQPVVALAPLWLQHHRGTSPHLALTLG